MFPSQYPAPLLTRIQDGLVSLIQSFIRSNLTGEGRMIGEPILKDAGPVPNPQQSLRVTSNLRVSGTTRWLCTSKGPENALCGPGFALQTSKYKS